MSPTNASGIPWASWTDRLLGRLEDWAELEPDLAGLGSLTELAGVVHEPGEPSRADAILGALVRIAAQDGGDDRDAALVVAHLLANGTRRMAFQLRDLSADIDTIVAGQLWLQIREFPCRRRTRAFAKNILLDTKRAVLAELRPYRDSYGQDRVLPVDFSLDAPGPAPSWLSRVLSQSFLDPQDQPDVYLADVLEWAQRTGAITAADAATLADLANADPLKSAGSRRKVRGVNSAAEILDLARRRGVSEKTIRRHRDRAVGSLRSVRSEYLAAIA